MNIALLQRASSQRASLSHRKTLAVLRQVTRPEYWGAIRLGLPGTGRARYPQLLIGPLPTVSVCRPRHQVTPRCSRLPAHPSASKQGTCITSHRMRARQLVCHEGAERGPGPHVVGDRFRWPFSRAPALPKHRDPSLARGAQSSIPAAPASLPRGGGCLDFLPSHPPPLSTAENKKQPPPSHVWPASA
ncbi:hypothetical protein GQ53DRAFT_106339 [Thozetella sp. PMI_491]|nr:hypothetical protein GQ53DRAFT_106339 [Thozetella sp. PMI_491]